MIEREITTTAYQLGLIEYMNCKFVNFRLNKGGLHDLQLSFSINNKKVSTPLNDADLLMSLDDFTDRIIHPLVVSLTRQDRVTGDITMRKITIYRDDSTVQIIYENVKHIFWTANNSVLVIAQYTNLKTKEHKYFHWLRERICWFKDEKQ